MERARAKRLVLFNHKGGVGKTTLTANLAFAFAESGLKVLLVDADPQGNLSSYFLDEEIVNDLLDRSDSNEGGTLWSALRPVVEGVGYANLIKRVEFEEKIFLLPGDIQLAAFETELADYWGECFQRRMRGLRGTQALANTVNTHAAQCNADLVLYDCGPNVGPLTRAVLLDCDYFAIPAACDLFSNRAIKTLGHTLARWILDWRSICELFPPSSVEMRGAPQVIGCIPQRFRVYGGLPSLDFRRMLPIMERSIKEDVVGVLARVDEALVSAATPPLMLPEVKDFSGMATAAQRSGRPLWRVDGTTDDRLREARAVFHDLAEAILHRLGGGR